MNRKMLFFVNPNAGHAEIRSSLMEVLQIFTEAGYDVTVHPTLSRGDLTDYIARNGEQYDCIVCTGGDGTLNEAVSGLMQLERRPPLGYIPGGTMNDVAASLGLSRDTVQAARDIVAGRPFPVDVGSFGDGRWFLYVAAFGLFTDVPYETPQQDKRVLGRLAYLLNGVRALSEVRPIHVTVTCGGRVLEEDVLDALVCSTTSVAGFRPHKDLGVSLNDGRFEVVLVRDIKNLTDFSAAAAHLLRAEFEEPYFVSMQADEIGFRFCEDVSWTLDGEFGGQLRSVRIRNHQRAVDILVPR